MGMLNWMMKNSVIGGIYNRPVAIANYTHFFIGVLALGKGLFNAHGLPVMFWGLAVVYLIFTVLYGFIFYRNPIIP